MFDELAERSLMSPLAGAKHTYVRLAIIVYCQIVLFLPNCAHVDWNWPMSRKKYLKIDWSVKMPFHWLIMGVAGS